MPFSSDQESLTKEAAESFLNLFKYLLFGVGPLASTSVELDSYSKSGLREDLYGVPDIQFHLTSGRK
jgi:hypothetical protein